MKIEYLGHSSFKLTSNCGTSAVTDPFDPAIGFKMPNVSADAVTVSHNHFDHNNIKAVGGNPLIVQGASGCRLSGMEISSVKSFHDPFGGTKRGENYIFKFLIDGLNVCHLGDLGEPCSSELIKKILPVDVLLIPVGGNYTINATEAKEYVLRLKPQIVIPMHYRTDGLNVDIENIDKFISFFADGATKCNCSEIELGKNDLTGHTRILVLRRA